ncbi:hypothetical protein H5V45_18600 [Nocardioides sp. KIGAM211]|uniref:GerMN domain-containing protein n=1 Tax=Nocardioides luti TaxID=2761101 RepID=A0A7X0RLM7_9ACTN|nr:Gmad2 immunoglobulin-like domain-containing protein [Nocardioides luti]MBB6629344.1 hypothetical protein [Nocardioides luti]
MTGLPRSRRTTLVPLAVLALAAGLLVGCSSSDDDQRPAGSATKKHHGQRGGGSGSDGSDGSGSEPDGSGSSSGGSSDAGDGSADGSGEVTVPVYFVGDTPQGPRLYREFRRVDGADPLDAALTLAASGDALDGDYRTLLPSGAFSGSTHDEGAVVRLPDDSWTRPADGMTTDEALLAVQQLVYTAQGVLQQRLPVTFADADGNATQIFGIASEDGFGAADPLETLALASVTQPEEGETVGPTFTAEGVASSFEATVPWEIRQGGSVVKKGFATADGWMDKLYPFRTDVDVSDLAPGTYTFVAMTDDPSGGEGGGPTEDSKTIVVR